MTQLTRREALRGMAMAAMLPAQIKMSAATSQPLEAARSGSPIDSFEVIDTHGHIDETPPDAVWPRNVDLLMKDMDRCGTRQIVVSHFGALAATSDESLRQAHDRCIQAAERFPGRLRAYVVVQPYLDASKAEMERILVANSIFSGLKLHGALHQYPADGPVYQAAYKFASDHSLPVLFHVGPGLEHVGAMAERYPGMKLILAHYAGGSPAVLKWVRDMPNLFVDTCTSNGPRHIVEKLRDACGPEKILYGSDSVYLCMGSQIARIAFARISDEEKRRIYGRNARAIFGNRLAPPA